MRAAPTLETTNSTNHYIKYANDAGTNFNTIARDGVTTPRQLVCYMSVSGTSGHACMIRCNASTAFVAAVSEL